MAQIILDRRCENPQILSRCSSVDSDLRSAFHSHSAAVYNLRYAVSPHVQFISGILGLFARCQKLKILHIWKYKCIFDNVFGCKMKYQEYRSTFTTFLQPIYGSKYSMDLDPQVDKSAIHDLSAIHASLFQMHFATFSSYLYHY